jgi:hypothetical protein
VPESFDSPQSLRFLRLAQEDSPLGVDVIFGLSQPALLREPFPQGLKSRCYEALNRRHKCLLHPVIDTSFGSRAGLLWKR